MRKLILIAALVLASASAQADEKRGLTLASNDQPAVAQQPTSADTLKYAERPPGVDQAQTAAQATQPYTRVAQAGLRKHRHESTETRIIHELHRHGVFW